MDDPQKPAESNIEHLSRSKSNPGFILDFLGLFGLWFCSGTWCEVKGSQREEFTKDLRNFQRTILQSPLNICS